MLVIKGYTPTEYAELLPVSAYEGEPRWEPGEIRRLSRSGYMIMYEDTPLRPGSGTNECLMAIQETMERKSGNFRIYNDYDKAVSYLSMLQREDEEHARHSMLVEVSFDIEADEFRDSKVERTGDHYSVNDIATGEFAIDGVFSSPSEAFKCYLLAHTDCNPDVLITHTDTGERYVPTEESMSNGFSVRPEK